MESSTERQVKYVKVKFSIYLCPKLFTVWKKGQRKKRKVLESQCFLSFNGKCPSTSRLPAVNMGLGSEVVTERCNGVVARQLGEISKLGKN